MSEFTDCLKESLAVCYDQFGTSATFGSTSVTGILSTVTRRENLELNGYDLDLNATFTCDKDVIGTAPTIGSKMQSNSVTYRIISVDFNISNLVLGLKEE
jgi:hypothetical protein